ncbi:MAG: ATP phosphoribosyltransferase [Bacteroidetes bacterium]|nr:ATP phosphoribosyltransferase [Bacteroidota bacterium]
MEKIKIALQRKGRLNEKSLELLNEAGIEINNGGGRLISGSSNFPVEILYLRDDDIPATVQSGVADMGIVGQNIVNEKDANITFAEMLGFARCRLSLAVPKHIGYSGISWFNGKEIATSYPRILSSYLKENQLDARIVPISGSVEIATGIGLADAVFDIVSTGSTLISNGLKEAEVVMLSQAVVITNNDLSEGKKQTLGRLLFRIRAVKNAANNKYILLNAPEKAIHEICDVIPGMKSPTILPLAVPGWCSLHSVINENDFWNVTERLKELGAQGILVVPIEKMII